MAVEIASAYVSLIPSARGIGAAIAKELEGPIGKAADSAGKDAGDRLSKGLLGGAKNIGKDLAVKLGLVAVGALAIKSAIDVEGAQNIIIRATGASGKAADRLEESFRNVASGTGASFEVVATTLAELYQRTGLQGKALETLTSQVVTFNRMSKDSPITVEAFTKAVAGFNVPAKEMGSELDHLFVIAQKTGVPLAELLQTVQTAGPIARQFGLSLDTTASFLAQLNKAGIDANTILPGLRKVFNDAAVAGKEPVAALKDFLTQLDGLVKKGDIVAARNLAQQIFGSRGIGLVDAALSGKVSLKSLSEQVDITGDGILDTAGKTGTLSGAMGILRNNAALALASFATPALQAANELLRGLLPTIRSLGEDFAKLPDPIKVGAAAALALVAAIGPLGNAAEGITALATIGKSVATGFQLAAVRGLELVDSIKAMSLAGAAASVGLVVGFAAIAAGILYVATAQRKLLPGFAAAEDAGKRLAQVVVAGARASGDEIGTLQGKIKDLDANIRVLQELLDRRTGGSLELQAEDKAATSAALSLKQLSTQREVLNKRLAEAKIAHAEEKAALEEAQAGVARYASALATGATQTQALAAAGEAGQTAIQNFQNVLLAAAGGAVGYAQSQANLTEAQNDYNLAVFLFGPASAEAAAAQLTLNQAQLGNVQAAQSADAAQQALIDSLISGNTTYEEQKALLQEQIRLHPENAAGIQLEIDKLDAANFAAIVLGAADPSVEVTAPGVDDVIAKLAVLIDQINSINAGGDLNVPDIAGLDAFIRAGGHAAGGVFTKPHIALFAEAGPEAVLPLDDPKRSMQILAKTDLFETAVASGGGLQIGTAYFGDSNVIPDLDYFARTRMAGV